MIGWRVWRVVDGRLVAPFAGDVLADDGIAITDPPSVFGEDGIHFYPDRSDVIKASTLLPDSVVSSGEVSGQTCPDRRAQLYTVNDRPVILPTGRRCGRYRVTAIYADVPMIDYGVPVLSLKKL